MVNAILGLVRGLLALVILGFLYVFFVGLLFVGGAVAWDGTKGLVEGDASLHGARRRGRGDDGRAAARGFAGDQLRVPQAHRRGRPKERLMGCPGLCAADSIDPAR